MPTPYEILGVDPDATAEEIKKAYRRLAQEAHPDKFGGDNTEAQERFVAITNAYQTLSDERSRAKLDRSLAPIDSVQDLFKTEAGMAIAAKYQPKAVNAAAVGNDLFLLVDMEPDALVQEIHLPDGREFALDCSVDVEKTPWAVVPGLGQKSVVPGNLFLKLWRKQ